MELIKKWLAGKRNYHVGVVLFNQYSKDDKLKKLFTGPRSDYLQKRLENELSAMLQKPMALTTVKVANAEVELMPDENEPVLKALRNEWLPLYQRMNYLRHELDRWEGNSLAAVEARKPIAVEILNLEQQCLVIWNRRDHYLEHGQLPEVKNKQFDLPTDPIELGKEIENTKRNIRRNKLLIKQHPDNVVYPLKLKYYQDKMDAIEDQLKKNERK